RRWRRPAPHEAPGEAQRVEPRRVVARDAGGEDLALPGRRRGGEAGELREHGGQRLGALAARLGVDLLPAEEEAGEVGAADGADLGAQAVEGGAVDAGEEAALA